MTAKTCFYRGPSMAPLLRFGDVLRLDPVDKETLRRGDVIVYRPGPRDGLVVHRVIGIADNSVKTRGDSNSQEDPYLVGFDQIVGVVRSARRGKKMLRIHGGVPGRIVAALMRLRRILVAAMLLALKGPYRALVRWGFLKRFLSGKLDLRVVSFRRGDLVELQLFVGGIPAGLLRPNETRWEIRHPFKLVVDEASLPTHERSPGEGPYY